MSTEVSAIVRVCNHAHMHVHGMRARVMYCAVSFRKNVCIHLAASQPLLVNRGICAVHESYLL